jgi:citrate synthase
MGHLVTASVAATRLGVDLRTVYAYASRGSLRRAGTDADRRSLYDSDEIELLARRGRPRTARRGSAGIDVVIGSAVSTVLDGVIAYRGQPVSQLVKDGVPFEAVAELLWTGDSPTQARWPVSRPLCTTVRAATRHLDARVPGLARMAVGLASAAPLLSDLENHGESTQTGQGCVSVLIDALGPPTSSIATPYGVAERAWSALSSLPATRARLQALNTALVVLADHELATSTLAVRIAASARADLSSCLQAGLGALAGTAHSGAADRLHRHLLERHRPGPGPIEPLRRPRLNPYGVAAVHPNGDPRLPLLIDVVLPIGNAAQRRRIERARSDAAEHSTPLNVDFALATLCYAAQMPPGSASSLFAIARSAGWIAHAREELDERPLRFRGRAVPRAIRQLVTSPG